MDIIRGNCGRFCDKILGSGPLYSRIPLGTFAPLYYHIPRGNGNSRPYPVSHMGYAGIRLAKSFNCARGGDQCAAAEQKQDCLSAMAEKIIVPKKIFPTSVYEKKTKAEGARAINHFQCAKIRRS
jgi:hypothetical protein